MARRLFYLLSILVAFAAGFAASHYAEGEWKAVGDGLNVMHSRTGEIKRIRPYVPDTEVSAPPAQPTETKGRVWKKATIEEAFPDAKKE